MAVRDRRGLNLVRKFFILQKVLQKVASVVINPSSSAGDINDPAKLKL